MIFIKVEVYGKHIKYLYQVKPNQKEILVNGEKKDVFFARPELDVKSVYEYEKISEFELDSGIINNLWGAELLFEGESVSVLKRKIRLDTGVLEINISKTLSETDENKISAELELGEYIGAFNEQMIWSNEHLKKYCEVHKLDPRQTDVLTLWDVVYPENDYNIMDGKMVKVPKPGGCTIGSTTIFGNTPIYAIDAKDSCCKTIACKADAVCSGTAYNGILKPYDCDRYTTSIGSV